MKSAGVTPGILSPENPASHVSVDDTVRIAILPNPAFGTAAAKRASRGTTHEQILSSCDRRDRHRHRHRMQREQRHEPHSDTGLAIRESVRRARGEGDPRPAWRSMGRSHRPRRPPRRHSLRFDADALTEAARCKWTDGTTLLAGAKGQSRTTPKAEGELCLPLGSGKTRCGEIETLQSVADRKTFGGKWCAVSMTPQAYEYRISGTKARLMLGAEPFDLVKLSD